MQNALPSTVWVLALVTLLTNLSSVMIYSISPVYMTKVFGLTVFTISLLDGMIEFVSWTMRIFSGMLSDYLNKRKPLLMTAAAFIAFSRPIFVLAPGVVWIYGAKLIDRISNGLQASPREALIGDAAPEHLRGACFGMRQSLGVAGSLIGAAAVMGLMRYSGNNYALIFWVACFPPLLAFLALLFFVKDKPCQKEEKKKFVSLNRLSFPFWMIIAVAGVFMMSNYGGAYRILQAERKGMPVSDLSLVLVLQNLGIMLSAYPIGRLSDRLGRRPILALGFGMAILSNLCFCRLEGSLGVFIGTITWGLQMGMTQSLLLSMVADTAGEDLKGTAFGVYYLVNAFALAIANVLTGWLTQKYGADTAFGASSALAAAGLFLIPIIPKKEVLLIPVQE